MKKKPLALYRNDPWLAPHADAIEGRHADAVRKEAELTANSNSLKDFANAHQYFGLHRQGAGGFSANGRPMPGRFSW